MRRRERLSSVLLGAAMLTCCVPALAEGWFGDQGKLPLTAGFSTVEGAGGGGLTPWALITGYGSRDSWGANTHVTGIALRDFDFSSVGIGVGIRDRFELSFSRQQLEATDGALDGISVDDVDYYASATKIWLAQGLLVNATVRYTRANQFGLLGFGGDRDDDAALRTEGSVAYLLRRKVAIGVEYRSRGRNLGGDEEGAAWDAFVACTLNRNVSIVAAYVNLGSIAAPLAGQSADQDGAYLSAQVGF